ALPISCIYELSPEKGGEATHTGVFFADTIRNKTFMVVRKNGKYGIVDTANRALVRVKYDGIYRPVSWPGSVPPRFFVVVMDGKKGLIDTLNNMILPPEYEHIMWTNNPGEHRIWLWKDKRRLIADSNGKIIVDIPGYSADFPQGSLIPVRKLGGNAC